MDEPTIGLDIVVKSEIREFLKDMNREHGTTILLTTHDLQDIEALCSRVIMLDDGRIIYDGGLEDLKQRWGTGREVVFQFGTATKLSRIMQWTEGMPVTWTAENDLAAKVWIPLELNVSDVLGRVVGHGHNRHQDYRNQHGRYCPQHLSVRIGGETGRDDRGFAGRERGHTCRTSLTPLFPAPRVAPLPLEDSRKMDADFCWALILILSASAF